VPSSAARAASPCIAHTHVPFRDSSLKQVLWKPNLLFNAPTELGTCRCVLCTLAASPVFSMRDGSVSAHFPSYTRRRETERIQISSLASLSLCPVSFVVSSFSLPHSNDCVHAHPGEQASETPSIEILHREAGDKLFLGSTSA
jgi:hypothetical protein